jgi:zinc metalloprotease ZmpB
MPFELDDNVNVELDNDGQVQHLEHVQKPFVASSAEAFMADEPETSGFANTAQNLANQYLREVADVYGLHDDMLPGGGDANLLLADEPSSTGSKLEPTEPKEILGTTTVAYQQTYGGLPVWEAGLSVTIQPNPMRVTASQSSVHHDVTVPPADALDESAGPNPTISPERLKQLLGSPDGELVINGQSQLIYRYDPAQRIDPAATNPSNEALQGGPPTLPLPPVPETITAGQHYVVTEVLFTLPAPGFGPVNWRTFIDVATETVLYLRAFVACANGMIFRVDPVTATGNTTLRPTSSDALLNQLRNSISLEGLNAPNDGAPQELTGKFVQVVSVSPPAIVPPTQPQPADFAFNTSSDDFAAVNAYHHCDGLFRLMQGMGFSLASYFDGTVFPVPVDHRATIGPNCAGGNCINASAPGNTSGKGSDGFRFALAGVPTGGGTTVGIAADVRVVLHEFGHTILWDSVHSPNFGFAHSPGDSLAAILLDPESALRNDPVRRFHTFPWVIPNRNHGRDVADGWGWDGVEYAPFNPLRDRAGYKAEQILSSTLFRAYRSAGGDSESLNRRKFASRLLAYFIFRAVGSLASNPVTKTPRPEIFATALINADIGTRDFEGYKGGAFHKVIHWSFEKQGLYQPPDSPRPVTTAGAPPNVDVFIDDGRHGEYQFEPVYWDTTDIWNRLAPGMAGGTHQTPVVGQTNFAYVRVRNRGSQQANNVVVRGYSANPSAVLSWPDDWTPMDTPQLDVAGGIPPGGDVVVGPFSWTPRNIGNETMLMEVSADGDFSNIDPRTFFPCATGPTQEWQLVPFDNNLGQRNVAPIAGTGPQEDSYAEAMGITFGENEGADAAHQLLSQLGIAEKVGKVGSVKMKKITVEIELG